MSNPEISIIIPIYKTAEFLQPTLESIAHQTYLKKNSDAFEILFIVDGECEPYEHKIPSALKPWMKIEIIPHCGVSATRNYAIKKANASKFIAFIDADDIWLPEKIEKQIRAFNENVNLGMVYTNSYWIGKTGEVLSRTQKDQYGFLPSGNISAYMLERDYIITSSVMVKKEVFQNVGVFDTELEVCEDWELKIKIAKAYSVQALQDPLIYYRLHLNGTHYKCAKMLECGYRVFHRHIDSIKKDKNLNGEKIIQWKSNIPLNLAGSWLYIDQTRQARHYLWEAFKLNKTNKRLYLMFILSVCPKALRDFLLNLRDKLPFLP